MNILDNIEIKNKIIEFCSATPQIEACGITTEKDGVLEVFKCDNVAAKPNQDFIIPRKQIKELSKNKTILGYWHSHDKDVNPSQVDWAVINRMNLSCIIYCVSTGEIKEFSPISDNWIPDFINRPFLVGYLDCSELVRDFYLKDLNISLPKLEHEIKYLTWDEIKEDWDNLAAKYNRADYNFLLDYFTSNNFRVLPKKIEEKQMKRGDIILCRAKEIAAPVHCIIYLGNNNILHHPSQRLSLYENYNGFYKSLTTHVLRYNY